MLGFWDLFWRREVIGLLMFVINRLSFKELLFPKVWELNLDFKFLGNWKRGICGGLLIISKKLKLSKGRNKESLKNKVSSTNRNKKNRNSYNNNKEYQSWLTERLMSLWLILDNLRLSNSWTTCNCWPLEMFWLMRLRSSVIFAFWANSWSRSRMDYY